MKSSLKVHHLLAVEIKLMNVKHVTNDSNNRRGQQWLTLHEAIQSAYYPHMCDTYGNGFTQRGDLNKRQCIHPEEKPDKCDTIYVITTFHGTLNNMCVFTLLIKCVTNY